MEFHDGKLRFSSPVFAYHLAAKKLIRYFAESPQCFISNLDRLDIIHKYKILVIASTIIKHVNTSEFSFSESIELPFEAADCIVDYLKERWNDIDLDYAERSIIISEAKNILSNTYGENVFTGRNANSEHRRWIAHIANHN